MVPDVKYNEAYISFVLVHSEWRRGGIGTYMIYHLSNDPGKKGSNFFCCGAIRFPHIEMFSFLHRECINLQKGCLRKKMYLNSTFKGCIFVLKHFDQSQELQTMAKKCSQFYMIRTYDFCVT